MPAPKNNQHATKAPSETLDGRFAGRTKQSHLDKWDKRAAKEGITRSQWIAKACESMDLIMEVLEQHKQEKK